MYISPLGRSLALSQSFGKTRLANNIYEINTAEDRASVQGLYDISKNLGINEDHMPIMQQFLALPSSSSHNKLPAGYKIPAIATPDLQKPERISENPNNIKEITEFAQKDATHTITSK